MGFWGIEVKPGKPVEYQFSELEGRVNVTQATLGSGDSKERSALQCSIGENEPVFLCSLLPNKVECCPLNLEFEEDEVVSFKVVGPRSIHLSGILLPDEGDEESYDSDCCGDDIADSDGESSEYDIEDEYDDEFMNDGDLDMLPDSPVRKIGVIIEEIEDDEKPKNADKGAQQPKKIKFSNSSDVPVLESEDEDGFPVSSSKKPNTEAGKAVVENTKKQEKDGGDDSTVLKRKIESVEIDGQQESKKKKKKKQKQKEQVEEGKTLESKPEEESRVLPSKGEKGQKLVNENGDSASAENGSEKKKKKNKKKKGQNQEDKNTASDQKVAATGDKQNSKAQLEEEIEPSQVRSFPNGLVIEELAMGKPDGKRASPGKQVSVRYIGKLKKNGKIFDSNVGKAPFRFRLGVGQVIKGWDVGVNGMRVGDKRRLTIPPVMGYGAKGAGGVIPPNAWLVFDVELVDVR